MSDIPVDMALSRRTELPPAIGRLTAVLTAALGAGLVMYGWWAVSACLLLFIIGAGIKDEPMLMGQLGLGILTFGAGIYFAAPLVILLRALLVCSLVDHR